MITNAANRTVQQTASAVPSLQATIPGWFRSLTLGRITKKTVDFQVVEVEQKQPCQGVLQVLDPQSLKMKPDGQRAWKWMMLHTTPDVKLSPDERFTIDATPYRVKAEKDYSAYGYICYELVEDYNR